MFKKFVKGLKNDVSPPNITLLLLMKAIQRETLHAIYPDYSEEKIYSLTDEWLNNYDWSVMKSRLEEK
jgi:hypothetical protein